MSLLVNYPKKGLTKALSPETVQKASDLSWWYVNIPGDKSEGFPEIVTKDPDLNRRIATEGNVRFVADVISYVIWKAHGGRHVSSAYSYPSKYRPLDEGAVQLLDLVLRTLHHARR